MLKSRHDCHSVQSVGHGTHACSLKHTVCEYDFILFASLHRASIWMLRTGHITLTSALSETERSFLHWHWQIYPRHFEASGENELG